MIEKVNPKHPDKVADRIAGAIVDLGYKLQENPKIAVEVLIGHGVCHVIVETSVDFNKEDIEKIKGALTKIKNDENKLLDYFLTSQIQSDALTNRLNTLSSERKELEKKKATKIAIVGVCVVISIFPVSKL